MFLFVAILRRPLEPVEEHLHRITCLTELRLSERELWKKQLNVPPGRSSDAWRDRRRFLLQGLMDLFSGHATDSMGAQHRTNLRQAESSSLFWRWRASDERNQPFSA